MAIPHTMLYNFEVHAHAIRRMTTPLPEGGSSRLAFKLDDYPTLMVDCGPVYQGEMICEKGKSCMFESDPTSLTERLPLSLRCMLLDVRGAEKYHILASNKITLGSGQRGSSLSLSLNKYDLTLKDGFGNSYCELIVTIHLSLLGPYHNGEYQLPPTHSVHEFLSSEVSTPLESLLNNTVSYLQSVPLTIADCGPTASAVFSQQVSLLQQLQHNTTKMYKIIADAHYQKTGLPLEVVRQKRTKKKKKLIVRNIVIETGNDEHDPSGRVEAHALLFVTVAGIVVAGLHKPAVVEGISDRASPLFLPNPEFNRYDTTESELVDTPQQPSSHKVPPPLLSKSPIKIHEKREGDTGYSETEYLHHIPPVSHQTQNDDPIEEVVDEYNDNIENDENSIVLHHATTEEVSTGSDFSEA
eukprot:TRINITY_DN37562_c0_g1_i1.p1 TRINITY_DN37562_c0_g1~~TRINITY_DN37562_c0_g1_i1.p1  ORF type:complete len:422 (+),score=58.42 TRINITY_DN37562_c0_g1_i1:33-1268(+)